jgi:hypothetical protein
VPVSEDGSGERAGPAGQEGEHAENLSNALKLVNAILLLQYAINRTRYAKP